MHVPIMPIEQLAMHIAGSQSHAQFSMLHFVGPAHAGHMHPDPLLMFDDADDDPPPAPFDAVGLHMQVVPMQVPLQSAEQAAASHWHVQPAIGSQN
jgi:hypothetical protein